MVFPKIVVPQNGWFIMEHHIKMDNLGVPPFKETSIYKNTSYMYYKYWFIHHYWSTDRPKRHDGFSTRSQWEFTTWGQWLVSQKTQRKSHTIILVGGFNPIEKYARQIGNLPQETRGESKTFLKPPSGIVIVEKTVKGVSTIDKQNPTS